MHLLRRVGFICVTSILVKRTNSTFVKTMNAISQGITSTQFYLYGKQYFTRNGWDNAVKRYETPDVLSDPNLNLNGKVFLVTGATAGIGLEIAKFISSKNARCYLMCRNAEKAEAIKRHLIEQSHNEKIHILLGDCGIREDIQRCWNEFISRQQYEKEGARLDCLICNAGVLNNEKKMTKDKIEATFATNLLFGTYYLGKLAIPVLENTEGSRLIAVSSGGMYNTKFPRWEIATSQDANTPYDGQFAYCYTKRGQVLLCEYWAKKYPKVSFVSCHPGWVDTEGVNAVYGEKKSWLEPLRNSWQGTEGIIWLAVCPKQSLQSGEFYLDRQVQRKHLAGIFFTEGSFTKNTNDEVEEMVRKLDAAT